MAIGPTGVYALAGPVIQEASAVGQVGGESGVQPPLVGHICR